MADVATAMKEALSATRRSISEALRKLLEEKHLYQAIEIQRDHSVGVLAKKANRNPTDELVLIRAYEYFDGKWFLRHRPDADVPDDGALSVDLPHIKTYCQQKCERIEPFAPFFALDVIRSTEDTYTSPKGAVQKFALSYLCQACRLVPEVFIVQRVGPKLTICGRSPIEHVDVPKYIPAKARDYFSGAIVAYQSGQTLAGLFLLRTAIEQWIRSLGATHDKADQALEWYMSTLPSDFKSWAPSLRDVYAYLSDVMHKADSSSAVFERAKADIEKHFDARRVRDLKESAGKLD